MLADTSSLFLIPGAFGLSRMVQEFCAVAGLPSVFAGGGFLTRRGYGGPLDGHSTDQSSLLVAGCSFPVF